MHNIITYSEYNKINENHINDLQKRFDASLLRDDIQEDLEAHFKDWQRPELNFNNETFADALVKLLQIRHPKENLSKIKELAYNWVGYKKQ